MLVLTIRTDNPQAEIGLFLCVKSKLMQVDAAQGDGEERNEPYKRYGEMSTAARQRSDAPQTPAESSASADEQAGAVHEFRELAYEQWQAHRGLAETIHKKIQKLLKTQGKDWADVKGIVAFKGPGSFTGLRIGLTVANALAYGLNVPIVSTTEKDWKEQGMDKLKKGNDEKVAMPEYGAEANITKPKK